MLSIVLLGMIVPSSVQAKKPINIFLGFISTEAGGSSYVPYGIAITPNSEVVYVAAQSPVSPYTGEVFAINALTDTIIAAIPITGQSNTFGLAIDPKGEFLYVSNTGTTGTNGSVSVIRIADNTVIATIGSPIIGPYPAWLAVGPDGKYLWLANSGTGTLFDNGTVTVIELSDGNYTPVALIPTGGSPTQPVFSPKGKRVYVLNQAGTGYISIVNARTFNLDKPFFGLGLLINSYYSLSVNNDSVFVANQYESVLKLSAKGALDNAYNMFLPNVTGTELGQAVVTKNGEFLYVAESDVQSIGWVDLKTNTPERLSPIEVGGSPVFLTIAPNGKMLYASDQDNDGIDVIDIKQ